MADAFDIPVDGDALAAIRYGGAADRPLLVLAHGAGAGQQSAFMVEFAEAMVARTIGVVTFNFPYLQRGRRAPDRPGVLEESWRAVIRYLLDESPARTGRLVVGGKSMGGRIASQVLTQPVPGVGASPKRDLRADVAGLVLLGYPLHPPGQPDRLRVAHLPELRTPTLVVQGARDEFGTEREVRDAFAAVPVPVDWLVVPDGDHSLRRRGSRGLGVELPAIHDRVAEWIVRRVGLSS